MQDFEKLGAFYLGKRVAADTQTALDELVLYNSKDLTTHAAIIGMTGSGKTGLGIALIEEAAIDRIPVLAIDPKGDLANLLLTFPELRGQDFAPWVDPRVAEDNGQSVEEFAAQLADTWKQGLSNSGQSGERIRQLKANCDFAVYTPGSSAGAPLAVLSEFTRPAPEVRADSDIYNDLIDGTCNGLLSLLSIDADPVSSKEHILISNVLRTCWNAGTSLDLAGLINAIQKPPFSKVGVIDLDTFYPPKQRFALAMQINNLLAAPGFAAWMEGPPLDIDQLLYTASGQPRITVLSIAHLDDRQRMFFVTMLLNALVAWMRRQSGSSGLRALLYIDEIFGYLPPVENPPSKKPLLTLLKQARAFGLGLVLSTQNPVDLDYKALSNMGSWFIGRLQTERDKQRLLDGLRSAAGTGELDQETLSATISGLAKRCFLLHNVHETSPVLFTTRWVMAYLAGPMTREQLRKLAQNSSPPPAAASPTGVTTPTRPAAQSVPALDPAIKQVWLGAACMPREGKQLTYRPELLARIAVTYTNARAKVDISQVFALCVELAESDTQPDWNASQEYALTELQLLDKPVKDTRYAECSAALSAAANYTAWEKSLRNWIRIDRPLRLLKSSQLNVMSQPGEAEREFRIRLQQFGNAQRDSKVEHLREIYAQKMVRLEDKLMRAEQTVDREAQQATSSKIDTAVTVGSALLGALLGRKPVSATSLSRAGTAARKAGNLHKQSGDVDRAREHAGSIEQDIETLKAELAAEVAAMASAYDAQTDELGELLVRATSTNIRVEWLGIAWRAD